MLSLEFFIYINFPTTTTTSVVVVIVEVVVVVVMLITTITLTHFYHTLSSEDCVKSVMGTVLLHSKCMFSKLR